MKIPPQAYGTGVGALIEGKNWESLSDIAHVYSKWSSFHLHKEVPQDMRLFQRRLMTMDVTIKNEDNRETHILSADDYYSYHGGLIAAVRNAKGSRMSSAALCKGKRRTQNLFKP